MFEVEKEVSNLELSKKLKELGFPQEGGGWYWRVDEYRKWLSFYTDSEYKHKIPDEIFIKAPTCLEILEWIDVAYQKHITSDYLTEKLTYTPEEINPNRLAEDLIWLIENGYVEFRDV